MANGFLKIDFKNVRVLVAGCHVVLSGMRVAYTRSARERGRIRSEFINQCRFMGLQAL